MSINSEKHWGTGAPIFLCGINFDRNLFAGVNEVNCIECLKNAWKKDDSRWSDINENYPWIPAKIKQLEYKESFENLLGETK